MDLKISTQIIQSIKIIFFLIYWQVIAREARDFKIGGSVFYYALIMTTGIVWQGFFLGAIGIVFCASSLASAVLISVLLPVTEVLAVVCFREKFQADKGVALLLSLWGFVSYFYGEFKSGKKVLDKAQPQETELPPIPVSDSVVWKSFKVFFCFSITEHFGYTVWLCIF